MHSQGRSNPFGDARPREEVLKDMERLGVVTQAPAPGMGAGVNVTVTVGAPEGQRPKLNLKKRDPAAAQKADQERKSGAGKANPFGAARPREQVLAEKAGVAEKDIIAKDVEHDPLHLRLTRTQQETKEALEAKLADTKEVMALEAGDPAKLAELQAEYQGLELQLAEMLKEFERQAVEAAHSSEAREAAKLARQARLAEQQQQVFPPWS